MYQITNTEGLYWSNSQGWVTREDAETFADTKLNLPIGGMWIRSQMFVGTEHEIAMAKAKVDAERRALQGSLGNAVINAKELFAAINELAALCSTK